MDSRTAGARTEQRQEALVQATRVRQSRARLKRQIAAGEMTVAEVLLLGGPEVKSMAIGKLLLSQRSWGEDRCRRFLRPRLIEETKTIGSMTERQRVMLAAGLGSRDRA